MKYAVAQLLHARWRRAAVRLQSASPAQASVPASVQASVKASLEGSAPSPGLFAALVLVLALTAGMAGTAQAYERSDGVKVQCVIERNGERRTVPEEWLGHGESGDRHPALGGAAAVVRPDKDGWPVIFFDYVTMKGIRDNDPHMPDFIFYHECAHAADPTRDEIDANCEAYLALEQLGMMDEALERALARSHRKMMRLPSRYGGSGAVFWDKTMACVGERRSQRSATAAAGKN